MEGTMGNEGINKLAGVMQGRMKSVGEKPAVLDIGQIGSDMSLTTNQFPKPIPRSDYLVCRQLTLGATGEKLTETESGEKVKIPEKMRSIKPGDRVLVAWVGDDACVVDIIA